MKKTNDPKDPRTWTQEYFMEHMKDQMLLDALEVLETRRKKRDAKKLRQYLRVSGLQRHFERVGNLIHKLVFEPKKITAVEHRSQEFKQAQRIAKAIKAN